MSQLDEINQIIPLFSISLKINFIRLNNHCFFIIITTLIITFLGKFQLRIKIDYIILRCMSKLLNLI